VRIRFFFEKATVIKNVKGGGQRRLKERAPCMASFILMKDDDDSRALAPSRKMNSCGSRRDWDGEGYDSWEV
jgi:hypothetical protein